jgi:hypothetical protein
MKEAAFVGCFFCLCCNRCSPRAETNAEPLPWWFAPHPDEELDIPTTPNDVATALRGPATLVRRKVHTMIKTILTASILALGMSAGTAFAQERTFTAWGHEFTTSDTGAQTTVSALAGRPPMERRALAAERQASRRVSVDR